MAKTPESPEPHDPRDAKFKTLMDYVPRVRAEEFDAIRCAVKLVGFGSVGDEHRMRAALEAGIEELHDESAWAANRPMGEAEAACKSGETAGLRVGGPTGEPAPGC